MAKNLASSRVRLVFALILHVTMYEDVVTIETVFVFGLGKKKWREFGRREASLTLMKEEQAS
jgi:hypothetical protein